MATHTLPVENWPTALSKVLLIAEEGDEIIVTSEARKELGEIARQRVCPTKGITFIVEKPTS